MRYEQITIPQAETLMQAYTYVLENRRRYSLLKLPNGFTILKETISITEEPKILKFTPDGMFEDKDRATMNCTWKYILREWNSLMKSYPIFDWKSITPAKFSKHDGTKWQWTPVESDLLKNAVPVTINPKNTPQMLEQAKKSGKEGWFAWQKQFASKPIITGMDF